MLNEIGSIDNVEAFVADVKAGKGRLQGFGHRVYKNYDPRATIIKKIAYDVFEVTGKNPLLDIALKLEEIALSDDYFISRKLYPNVDFYSGLIYQAMGFPMEMFTVLFAIPRVVGLAGPLDRAARPGRRASPGPASSTWAPRSGTTSRWSPASPSWVSPSPRSTPSPTVRSRGTPPPSACSTAPPTSSGCRPSRPR